MRIHFYNRNECKFIEKHKFAKRSLANYLFIKLKGKFLDDESVILYIYIIFSFILLHKNKIFFYSILLITKKNWRRRVFFLIFER
jgi:hypothetical protein